MPEQTDFVNVPERPPLSSPRRDKKRGKPVSTHPGTVPYETRDRSQPAVICSVRPRRLWDKRLRYDVPDNMTETFDQHFLVQSGKVARVG